MLAAGCGGGSGGSASPSASRPSVHASPAQGGGSAALRVSPTGAPSVILRGPGKATFSFRFVGTPPAAWSWRVANYYGARMASGQSPSQGAGGSVSWNGTRRDGSKADPGLYLAQVGPVGAAPGAMKTIGWIRYYPPVKARVFNSLPAAGRKVALTFDDGGGATAWYWIIRELRDAHAKGTFFPIGEYVGVYAHREAGMTLSNHMAIGSHSWSHPDLTKLSDAQIRAQLQQTEQVWWQDFKASPVPYLRPPYGAYNAHVLSIAGQMGYSRIIMWDVDSNDWTNPGTGAIVHNVLSAVHNGSIIVLHTRGMAPKALPLIIAGLRARHYEMVSLPELFKAAGYR